MARISYQSDFDKSHSNCTFPTRLSAEPITPSSKVEKEKRLAKEEKQDLSKKESRNQFK